MNLEAGRELDRLIAEKVTGVEPVRVAIATRDGGMSAAVIENKRDGPFFSKADVERWIAERGQTEYVLGEWLRWPHYSTDIAAAWEVVELFPQIVIQRATSPDRTVTSYRVSLPDRNDPRRIGQPVRSIDADGETAPLAICRAALKAKAADARK